jgi:hypothetical protein
MKVQLEIWISAITTQFEENLLPIQLIPLSWMRAKAMQPQMRAPWAQTPTFQQRYSEHIHVCYHLIRDYIANGSVQIEYVTTDNQPADLLTKSLPPGLTKIFDDRIQ